MKKSLNTIFTIAMVVLILISVALLVIGFNSGWKESNVDVLLNWTYIMVGLALAAVIVVGLIVGAMNDAKGILKMLCLLVVLAGVCYAVYLFSPGSAAQGLLEQPEEGTLKLTDTVLNLTYITGALAILAIIVGEIRLAITNRKG